MYPVSIREEPARRVFGLAHTGPYTMIGAQFERLAAALGAAGLWPHVRGMATIAYCDPDSTPEAELQSFACAIVEGDAPCPDTLEERALAAGRFAVLELAGPYDQLGAAWGWLSGPWMAEAGEAAAMAPCHEVYLNSPADTRPDALRTELFAPLA